MKNNNFFDKLNFIRTHHLTELIVSIIVAIIALVWVYLTNFDAFKWSNMDSWYAKWLDPMITVGTFLLALYVWWDSKGREWREALPRRLTVHFKLADRYVMSCYNIKIGKTDDIRSFSQQLGRQIARGESLSFIPGFTEYAEKIITTNKKSIFRYHKVELHLIEKPDNINQYTYWILKKVDTQVLQDAPNQHTGILVTEKGEVHCCDTIEDGDFPTQPKAFNPETEM